MVIQIARFALILSLLVATTGHARIVSDVNLSEEITAPDGTVLNLNGAALRRTFMIVKTYVGGLYLETPTTDPQEVFQNDGNKRMLFHVLLRRVSARKVARALQEALVINLSHEEHMHIQDEIEQFLSMFDGKLEYGDEVNIDYLPNLGTQVSIQGRSKGIIPGQEFYRALLAVWIGDQPVSRDFKMKILGKEEAEPPKRHKFERDDW